jgi:hypothetical protein
MEKPKCYTCEYRRNIPGDTHSRCYHPDVQIINDNPIANIASLMGKHLGMPPIGMDVLGVTASEHGIKNGWFVWPLNFDPIWLESCNGYTTKNSR